MIAVDQRILSRTRGQEIDAPTKAKRRFRFGGETQEDALRKRDWAIYTLHTKHHTPTDELAVIFDLTQRHIQRILGDIRRFMELADVE